MNQAVYYSRHFGSRLFGTVNIMEIDILGINTMGVDILGIYILALPRVVTDDVVLHSRSSFLFFRMVCV